MPKESGKLQTILDDTFESLDHILENYTPKLQIQEIGTVSYVGKGIARVHGLPNVKSEEVVRFSGEKLGVVFNLEQEETAIVLLDRGVKANSQVLRTGRVVDTPVGEALLGRVVNPSGNPLDNLGSLSASERRPIERSAPAIMDRDPVTVPLQTGIQVIDALIPIGRGQRELILGDRQIGKTAIAVDTIINQIDKDVICVYCAIGQESSAVAKVIRDLRENNAMEYCVIVVATGEDPPGLNFIAPYAATTMAEYFMMQGRDVLIVYDDLTRHARAYRELSLLLRRPPAREAYPGDIFYIHSRLLERATHLNEEHNGGSLTAFPIIETQAQNISAYIPTNLISITDGQIYLSPTLFQEGVLPPVDVGESVSRVGGKTQLPAYRAITGDLRLSYSQFEELEAFARFGTRLDEETRKTLERGRRAREVLKQSQYSTIPVPEQIAVLVALNEGLFDDIPLEAIAEAKNAVREAAAERLGEINRRILGGEELSDDNIKEIVDVSKEALASIRKLNQDADN
jgi:F-type H+-transporting ATPase subunit alpha